MHKLSCKTRKLRSFFIDSMGLYTCLTPSSFLSCTLGMRHVNLYLRCSQCASALAGHFSINCFTSVANKGCNTCISFHLVAPKHAISCGDRQASRTEFGYAPPHQSLPHPFYYTSITTSKRCTANDRSGRLQRRTEQHVGAL